VLFVFFRLSSSLCASEKVTVFLIREVNIVVTMGMRELGRVPPVVLPEGVAAQVGCLAVVPGLELEVGDGAVFVEIGNGHGALVSVVVDHFSAEVPLLLLAESIENVVRAHFHYADLVSEAGIL